MSCKECFGTEILREINFADFRVWKPAILSISKSLNWDFGKIGTCKYVKIAFFE